MNHDQLTLENFAEKMGKRFRITRDQKARGLTREEAFGEWKNSQQSVGVAGTTEDNDDA